jgi:gliding motility-associated-like protein
MNIPGANNLWSANSFDTLIKVTQPGTYWVRVNIGECITTDTIHVWFQSLPVFSLGNDTTVCINQPLLLSASNNPSGVSYLWSTGLTSSTISINNPGAHWLQISDNSFGCMYRDSISVQFKSLPNYSLGPDTSLCQGNNLSLNAAVSGATNYLWSTGSTSSSINTTQTGVYWADVTKDQCTYRDSISVVFKPLPVVNFGKDTTLCENQTLLLDAGNSGSQYLWQNNSNTQSYNVSSPGQYFVKVSKDDCSLADTIKVQYEMKPVFSLGPDFGICEGQSILLKPIVQSISGIDYLWQNGSTSSSLAVTQPGLYTLDVSNYCGTKTDMINVVKGVCQLYVPTAFSPNGDGRNDIFKAEYGENITEFQLQIYNRWGQRIFESKNISTGWNGRFNGALQPNGAYVWIIKYKTLNDPKENLLKGTMMLFR